jgi:hypothetical protein
LWFLFWNILASVGQERSHDAKGLDFPPQRRQRILFFVQNLIRILHIYHLDKHQVLGRYIRGIKYTPEITHPTVDRAQPEHFSCHFRPGSNALNCLLRAGFAVLAANYTLS